jgi:hypothetical protein
MISVSCQDDLSGSGVPIARIRCMRKVLHTVAIAAMLLAPAAPSRAQVSFGIRIGQPPPPPRWYRVPPQPGPDYEWVEGYWYPESGRWIWHNGYWTRPPYEGAFWAAPYYDRGEYFDGRWEGARGSVNHNHEWDRSRQRDAGHDSQGNVRGNGSDRKREGQR